MKRFLLLIGVTILSLGAASTANATSPTPSGAVHQFFGGWKRDDFRTMYRAVHYSARRYTSASTLRNQYGFKQVRSWRIIKVSRGTWAMHDVTVRVAYRFANRLRRVTIRARVLKELPDGALSPDGRWGVNPSSTLRED